LKIVGTIEARMGSTRTPGKTLLEIYNGVPLLGIVYNRFKLCRNVDEVAVATTIKPADDRIAQWCEENRVPYYRGSEDDVLDRVVRTAVQAGADAIVQMGADSAYLDFELIDSLVDIYAQGGYDYVCNDLQLTFPLGIYGHVVSVPKLVELNERPDLSIHDREDVVRYIWEHPEDYRLLNIAAPARLAMPELRFTVDYPEDLELARKICARFGGYRFTTPDLISLYRREPELFAGTRNLVQRSAPFLKSKTYE
jgi:spore coat polysaccharide biosynthesis protein SpsF